MIGGYFLKFLCIIRDITSIVSLKFDQNGLDFAERLSNGMIIMGHLEPKWFLSYKCITPLTFTTGLVPLIAVLKSAENKKVTAEMSEKEHVLCLKYDFSVTKPLGGLNATIMPALDMLEHNPGEIILQNKSSKVFKIDTVLLQTYIEKLYSFQDSVRFVILDKILVLKTTKCKQAQISVDLAMKNPKGSEEKIAIEVPIKQLSMFLAKSRIFNDVEIAIPKKPLYMIFRMRYEEHNGSDRGWISLVVPSIERIENDAPHDLHLIESN